MLQSVVIKKTHCVKCIADELATVREHLCNNYVSALVALSIKLCVLLLLSLLTTVIGEWRIKMIIARDSELSCQISGTVPEIVYRLKYQFYFIYFRTSDIIEEEEEEDTTILTCAQKRTSSQLSLPHGTVN